MVRNGGGKEIVFLNLPIGYQFQNFQMNKNKIIYMGILKRILNIFSKNSPTTKTDTPQFIDLGLPSGLKWAKCNVGAEKETDYGFYFQWGDIEDKSNANCTWGSYKYYDDSHNTLTKYCNISDYGTVDNIITLETEDDTATQIMGSEWRMPTKDDFQELIDNTDSEWTQVNGVNGRKFTSKTDTSKYIFIPAAGYCGYGLVHYVGNYGGVWSSLLHTIYPYSACGLGFNLYNCYMGNNYRYGGRPVRGVRK